MDKGEGSISAQPFSCVKRRPSTATDYIDVVNHAEVDSELRSLIAAIEGVAAGDPQAGPIARLGQGERFHWLVAPSSTVIQPSEVHTGLSDDPAAELDHLFERLVR